MTTDGKNQDQKTELVSRRDLAEKVAYIAPVVLAVIKAAERPALASSGLVPL